MFNELLVTSLPDYSSTISKSNNSELGHLLDAVSVKNKTKLFQIVKKKFTIYRVAQKISHYQMIKESY